MKYNIRLLLFLTASVVFFTSNSQAGYSVDPWGSRTWKGPGRPPHWSPESTAPNKKQGKPSHPVVPGKPVDPDYEVRPPHRPKKKGGYWRDKYNRWHYHKKRRPGYIYYLEPREKETRVETVVIERKKYVPVYVPVKQEPSTPKCGGETITRKDPETGELVIEYVTGARDCP